MSEYEQEEAMVVDPTQLPSGSTPSASATPQYAQTHIQTPLLVDHSELGKLAELPATKAMKTHVKNLISKYSRLQTRLLKYNELLESGSDEDPIALKNTDEAVKAAKKFYQFRLLDLQSIRKDTLAELDRSLAAHVVFFLHQDVNNDLKDIVSKVAAAPQTLRQDLEHYKNQALSSSLLMSQEKIKYEGWWDQQITHNVERLKTFCIACKAGATSAVSDLCEFIANKCFEINNDILFGNLGAPSIDQGQHSHQPESQIEKQITQKKKGRSQRRRQKRRKQKTTDQYQTGWEREGIPQKGRTQGWSQKLQKTWKEQVFVNVHLDRNINIPSIVFRTLNLGANFQLAKIPQPEEIWQQWEKTKRTIVQKAGWEFEQKGQKQSLICSFNNIVAAVNDRRIYNLNYINKKLKSDKGLRTAANINNAMRTVFNFLQENNLFVILADKNLGLTIVDQTWYDIKMREHFNNTNAFEVITDWHTNVAGRGTSYMPYVTKAEFALRTVLNNHLNRGQSGILMDKLWKWENCAVPQSYGLIKLHKEPRKLRYITPVVQWVNVLVAKFVVSKLQPYVDSIEWILSSSMNFIPILQKCTGRSLWVGTWDISDMYNQIDQDESIQMIKILAG